MTCNNSMSMPQPFEDPNSMKGASSSERDPLIDSSASQRHKQVALLQITALCWSLFVLGWSDGSFGPLLPRMLTTFQIGYATLSWTFVFTCIGVLLGALTNMPLNDRFGYGKIIVIGSICQSVSFLMQAFPTSFPMFVSAFFIGGVGMAIEDAQSNGYVALLGRDGELKMGFLQASYGFGALVSPLSATKFSQTRHWSHHYLISFGLSMINSAVLIMVFQFKGQEACLCNAGEVVPEPTSMVTERDETNLRSKYGQLIRLKEVNLIALFMIVYIGVEVSIGGWISTFIIDVRGGGPDSGYFSSGFFGGLTLGRIFLVPVTQKVGEFNAVHLYLVVTILLQCTVWLVPSIPLNALAIFLIGLFLGPICPIALRHTGRVVPRKMVTGAIGFIAAYGAAGSALLPSVTGYLAERWTVSSIQPFLIVMMVFMSLIWKWVPSKRELLSQGLSE